MAEPEYCHRMERAPGRAAQRRAHVRPYARAAPPATGPDRPGHGIVAAPEVERHARLRPEGITESDWARADPAVGEGENPMTTEVIDGSPCGCLARVDRATRPTT